MAQAVSVKLIIDPNQGKRVVFAEVGKDCVDFLFHLLSLPVATIIGVLNVQGMAGSLPNLYQSLENLNSSYILPNQRKESYLKPTPPVSCSAVPLLAQTAADPLLKKFYICGQCSVYISDCTRATCPDCNGFINTSVTYIAPPAVEVVPEDGGLVKGVVTYMVMDDLTIIPMSAGATIDVLKESNISDVNSLEEKVVNLGMDQALKLLKASLQSKTVLSDVFFS